MMKLVLSTLAIIALGLTAADAATLNLSGLFDPHLQVGGGCHYNCNGGGGGGGGGGGVIPEPGTWSLMILGFALLARQVRAMRKARA